MTGVKEALRALILESFDWGRILPGLGVIAVLEAALLTPLTPGPPGTMVSFRSALS